MYLSEEAIRVVRKLMQELDFQANLDWSHTEPQRWLEDNAAALLEQHIALLQTRHESSKDNETILPELPATKQEFLRIWSNVIDVCWTTQSLQDVRSMLERLPEA